MKGITNEKIESLGSCNITLIFQHISLTHKIHVVNDNFQIPSHGILGKDFLKRFSCIVDHGEMTLTVSPKGIPPAKAYSN